MIFTLTINTINAAFELNAAEEVAHILKETAERLREEGLPDPRAFCLLRDSNGNKVGGYAMNEELR